MIILHTASGIKLKIYTTMFYAVKERKFPNGLALRRDKGRAEGQDQETFRRVLKEIRTKCPFSGIMAMMNAVIT